MQSFKASGVLIAGSKNLHHVQDQEVKQEGCQESREGHCVRERQSNVLGRRLMPKRRLHR